MNDPKTLHFERIAATLPVEDMHVATAFYYGDPVGFMILKRDGAEVHLTLQKDHKPASFNVAHLMVDNADALHELCKAHGLRIVKGLRDKDFGLRAFVFEDPDGNRIDVGQRLAD